MTKMIWKVAGIAALAAGLAACGSGNSTTAPVVPPVVVPPAPRLEDTFGTNFGTAYRADANTDARDPAPGDIIPLSLTTEATTI